MTNLDHYREWVVAAPTVRAVRQRLLQSAQRLSPLLLDTGTGLEAWRRFGLRVVSRDLGQVHGLLLRLPSGPIIAVNARDHPRKRRYTVAHELAHLLLHGLDRRAAGLGGKQEERMCDLFASHLLIPRSDLNSALVNFDDDPADLLALSGRYDVSLAPLLSATGELIEDRELVTFAVSRRAHPDRPKEVCPRVHRVLCGPYLMPEFARLTSLGLTCLDEQLESGVGEASGSDVAVRLRLWRPGAERRSGTATGPASWRVRRMANGVAVVCLHTPALSQRWAAARKAVVS